MCSVLVRLQNLVARSVLPGRAWRDGRGVRPHPGVHRASHHRGSHIAGHEARPAVPRRRQPGLTWSAGAGGLGRPSRPVGVRGKGSRAMNWRPSNGRKARDRGATAVEFALVLPLLLLLVCGIIDFGRALNAQITLTQAAREGARLEALGDSSGAVQTRTKAAAPDLSGGQRDDRASCAPGAGPAANATGQRQLFVLVHHTDRRHRRSPWWWGARRPCRADCFRGHAMRDLMASLIRLVQLRLRQDERGVIGVLVAVMIGGGVLTGMGALVVDLGQLYQERAELQNGADAAALGVAKSCALGTCTPSVAGQLADANASSLTGGSAAVLGLRLGRPWRLSAEHGAADKLPAAATGWHQLRRGLYVHADGRRLYPAAPGLRHDAAGQLQLSGQHGSRLRAGRVGRAGSRHDRRAHYLGLRVGPGNTRHPFAARAALPAEPAASAVC